MGKASSNKKVARAAKAGGGPSKVQINRSMGYYGGLAAISVIGLLLIAVSLHTKSRPDSTTAPRPQTDKSGGDHWHAAYGIYACDAYLQPIQGETLEKAGIVTDKYGLHAHNDGLVHIHPFTTHASGKNAKLGVWLDTMGFKLTKTAMILPSDKGLFKGPKFKNGDKCSGKRGEVHIFQYKGENDTNPVEIKYNPRDIRLAQDMILSFAFIPKDKKVPAPPSVKVLLSPPDVKSGSGRFSPNATTTPTTSPVSSVVVVNGADVLSTFPAVSTSASAATATTLAAASPTTAGSGTAPTASPTTIK